MNILFIGYGNMGSALGEIWHSSPKTDQIIALKNKMSSQFDVDIVTSISDIPVIKYDFIVLAIKPQLAEQIITILPDFIFKNSCIISLMAGVNINKIQKFTNKNNPIIRCMPNVAVSIQQGFTGLFSSQHLDPKIIAKIEHLFSLTGEFIWLANEEQLHAITALSGSGPAYYHFLSELLVESAKELGLSKHIAEKIITQTAFGSAAMQKNNPSSLEKLRLNVTSPNGTTQAAIDILSHNDEMKSLVHHAVNAAVKRSKHIENNDN
ncbi:MAG: pyrroline-5-carboxylate reductase [Pseudomonadales bacterium RIFCSPHIGHO2_12_FULL_40_16]|nr:MAG: pyrroline-5-carboxylate reductase [Pseudomonadales bacterium RIFCSPHIGHO2_12_FULL_40_16]HLB42679.1 pyrroline-5-carboxylate reductase [Gammaproteobacteria bacterium]